MNRTENDILFYCQEDILRNRKTEKVEETVTTFLYDYYLNNGAEINNNFSHDNFLGVACWAERFRPDIIAHIPTFGRHVLRPDNFALFFWIKNRKAGLAFLWIYFLFQLVDLIRMRKDHEGIPHTSGLLLNYFTMRTFKFNLAFSVTTRRVNESFKEGWKGVFKRYYTQENNVKVLKAFNDTY